MRSDLGKLKIAASMIRDRHPAYQPDKGPTYADNLANQFEALGVLIELAEQRIKEIGVFLDEPR
jgi:hypothetical protein